MINLHGGKVYLGHNNDGQPHGRGIMLFSQIDSDEKRWLYEGKFQYGKCHDIGILYLKSKEKDRLQFKGIWKENCLTGKVKVTKGKKETEVDLGNE